jgi:glucose-induced degradation protein 8
MLLTIFTFLNLVLFRHHHRRSTYYYSLISRTQSLPASPQLPMSLGPSSSGGGAAIGSGAIGSTSAGARGAPARQTFSRDDWNKRLADAPVSKKQINELVMNYLVIEGYKDAAERFCEESGVEPGVNLDTIGGRMATRIALQRGDVQGAMERANALDPSILDENDSLFFHLQQQKLIELIRAGQVEAALEFAQQELAPCGKENRDFLKELERTMTLLAFDDASKSPMADLLSPAQRQRTASELNAAILTSQCQEKEPKLPALLKTLLWAQDQLKERASFPIMDIRTGNLQDPSEDEAPAS